jgi:hypothetical protein
MSRTDKQTIFLELLEEATPCWRSVESEYLGNELYRIIGVKPDDELRAFSIGDVVKCKMKTFEGDRPQLVAHEKVNQ